MSRKIKKGDKVLVIAGNNRGQTGTVLRIDSEKERILVQGINIRKKHVKPTQQSPKGNILELEKPIHISNVQACDADGKPVKLKSRLDDKGDKVLYYIADGKEVVYRSLGKKS